MTPSPWTYLNHALNSVDRALMKHHLESSWQQQQLHQYYYAAPCSFVQHRQRRHVDPPKASAPLSCHVNHFQTAVINSFPAAPTIAMPPMTLLLGSKTVPTSIIMEPAITPVMMIVTQSLKTWLDKNSLGLTIILIMVVSTSTTATTIAAIVHWKVQEHQSWWNWPIVLERCMMCSSISKYSLLFVVCSQGNVLKN